MKVNRKKLDEQFAGALDDYAEHWPDAFAGNAAWLLQWVQQNHGLVWL
jgi:hypothetical protein